MALVLVPGVYVTLKDGRKIERVNGQDVIVHDDLIFITDGDGALMINTNTGAEAKIDATVAELVTAYSTAITDLTV